MRGIRFIQERKRAIELRKKGYSIVAIEEKLGINRSTLSAWFKNIRLTASQAGKLVANKRKALVGAQAKAAMWHGAQKAQRLIVAQRQATEVLVNLNLDDTNLLDLALAMLYWGEGFKRELGVGMGNADPKMLIFLVHVLKRNYKIANNQLTAQLHLRADQSEEAEIRYWSKILGIPEKNFKWTQFDKRTIGSKTYMNYHGVCTVYCHNVAIQRKLLNISRQFVETISRRKRA